MPTLFMDKPVEYWLEIERRLNENATLDAQKLLGEVVQLRGKISYYEARIAEMATLLPK